jgi:hypothetical protein
MSDTPITDAAVHPTQLLRRADGTSVEIVGAVTCRQLERELAEAKEELNDKRKFCYAVEQALDGPKGDYVEIIKELRKDAERYRWLRDEAQNTMKQQRAWLASNELDDNIDAAMKESLTVAEQEPAAWKDKTYGNLHHVDYGGSVPLYTAPPRREFVGLTDEEITEIRLKMFDAVATNYEAYRAIEAKLREKNT